MCDPDPSTLAAARQGNAAAFQACHRLAAPVLRAIERELQARYLAPLPPNWDPKPGSAMFRQLVNRWPETGEWAAYVEGSGA
jgi:hypothetical protein